VLDGLGVALSVIDSADNQILYNEFRDALGGGIMLELARNTVIRGNDLNGSKTGISLGESNNNVIESNNASGTLGTGIEVGDLSVSNEASASRASATGSRRTRSASTAASASTRSAPRTAAATSLRATWRCRSASA
jgi:parallel beta-helix repeat protein